MSQSFTFIDVAGNQPQYNVSEKDYHGGFRWSTDHGDHGVASSFEGAQLRARTVLNNSMAANRRSDETNKDGEVFLPLAITVNCHSTSPEPLVQANTSVQCPDWRR